MENDFLTKLKFLKEHESGFITDALRKLNLQGWIDGVHPMQSGATFIGEVFPVAYGDVAGDEKTYTLYETVDLCPSGSVLVMVGAHDKCVLGENVYTSAANKGIAALVCEGRCRDGSAIRAGKMPMFCEGVKTRLPQPSLRITRVGEPVICQGARLCPGDIMMGDEDGVVYIPREHFDQVYDLVVKIAEIEEQCAKALKEKAPVTEIGRLMKIKNSIGK